ncbi:hypothetical protein ACFLZ8_04050 [Planctomycetota bacterium]
MVQTDNRRREERLQYRWPVLFAEDFTQSLSEGLMVDVASGGISFMCKAGENCPKMDQQLVTRFSIPRTGEDDSSAMTSFTRTGRVLRIIEINPSTRQVAIQFDEPLTLKPCEQASIDLMHDKSTQSSE